LAGRHMGERVVEASVRVRYAETDAMGVAYHANYIIWFEVGRGEYMRRQGGSYADLERQGYALPVTEVSARYVAPCRYADLVTVRTRVEELKSRQVTFAYEIVDHAGKVLCTGRSVHICTDATGRVRTLPDWARLLLTG
jgi:acyl-CoA thioester hydrolase